jgi:hypothetical protein
MNPWIHKTNTHFYESGSTTPIAITQPKIEWVIFFATYQLKK